MPFRKKTSSYLGCNRCRENRDALSYFSGNFKSGGRVAICTPRVDVCNELFLRYRYVFPEEKITLLHGNTATAYTFTSFVICTIHQLYRFYRSFDLIVIDEIDAFPYNGDAGLAHAVQTAIRSNGRFIYLSATPDEKLLKEIKQTFEPPQTCLALSSALAS